MISVNVNIVVRGGADTKPFKKVGIELSDLFERFSVWLSWRRNFVATHNESMHNALCAVFEGRVERGILDMFEIDGPVYLPLFFAKQATNIAVFDAEIFPKGNSELMREHISVIVGLRQTDCMHQFGSVLFLSRLIFHIRKNRIYLSSVIVMDTARGN